ncbi:hypothetical protein [Xanthomonas cannabis]|uniref:Uncharacterized protein n=1 Tax=Xanthomonas cannabis TaxID=1885674 RepID=A0ABR6JHE4_9XANT|nr:hypothetical protein [Xanthomonas cannabis]MBB4591873.1 hypothetical protein [Xanthomonas cannabis]MBB5522145.1 hypothetical protein [Xanthomonas cannabis]
MSDDEGSGRQQPGAWRLRKLVIWAAIPSVFGFFAWILINGPTALQNSRALPSETIKTWSTFSAWLYEDEEWNGYWSASSEGYINSSEMDLSNSDLVLILSASNGALSGTVASKSICRAIPLFNYNLVDGGISITGNTASITIYDYIGGRKVELESLRLRRDGAVIEATSRGGLLQMPDSPIRIARRPHGSKDDNLEPDHQYCLEERNALFEKVREK